MEAGARMTTTISMLPPGFRFRPTDEELLTHYLAPKAANAAGFALAAVREVDIYKAEPWDLLPPPADAGGVVEDYEDATSAGGRYFFCRRSVKFPSGLRINRATRAGYWKSTGRDRAVLSSRAGAARGSGRPVGVRKTLVFYRGRAPRGDKTGWVMHEYRLLHGSGHAGYAAASSPVLAAAGAHHQAVHEEGRRRRNNDEPSAGAAGDRRRHSSSRPPPPPDDRVQEPPEPPQIHGCGGKKTTPAPAAHANCFSNIDRAAVAPAGGDNGMMDQSMLQLLKLNHHGSEEFLMSSYSGPPSGYAWSAAASASDSPPQPTLMHRDGHELPAAADSFDILPQLLDYEAFLHDF